MNSLALYVGSNDEESRILRRTLIRYLNLSLILVLRSISSAVKRRFPTMDHLVEAGFMTKTELEIFSSVPLSSQLNTYWVPCTWFISILKDARNEDQITDPSGLKLIMEEFSEFRSKCGLLWSYDWISIPLVYTQVVTVATYSFFIAALVGRQNVNETKREIQMEIDTYFPVFTILQFLFYMGLLKVAEQLINPFGEDDEDFELNWLIDRHTKVSYLGVDTLLEKTPPLVKDKYFDNVNMILPYTSAAFAFKRKTHRGSAHRIKIPKNQQTMYLPDVTDVQKDLKRQKNNEIFKSNTSSSEVWRKIDIEEAANFNENIYSIQQHPVPNIKKLFKGNATVCSYNVHDKPLKIIRMQRWQHRSFNSTIDSYCSTRNIVSDSSSEIYPEVDKILEVSGGSEKIKNKRKRRRSESSVEFSTGNLSSSQGISELNHHPANLWKGMSWRPVLRDSLVGTLSVNHTKIKGEKSVEAVRKTSINCQLEVDKTRKNAYPLFTKMDQPDRIKAYDERCKIYNNITISSPFAMSLPNLPLKIGFYNSSDEHVHSQENI